MKKLFGILAILAMVFSFVMAQMITPNEGLAKRAQEIKMVFAAPGYPEYGEGIGLNMYRNALEGRALSHPALKGKFKVRVFGGTLFNNMDECLTGVASGAAHMTYSGPHFLEQLDPAWRLGEAAGIFASWQHFLRAMETPPWKALHKKMTKEKGATIIKWIFNTGDWYFYTSKGPPTTLEAIKGQKIRFAGGEAFAKALKAMGTTPIALPYTEVVTALQTHMIDGLVTDFTGGYYFYNLERYTKYAVDLPITIQPICWVVNTKWWESLPSEARKAMQDVFDRVDVSKFYIDFQGTAMQDWRNNPKLEMITLRDAEADRWIKTMRSAVKDMLVGIDPIYIKAIDSVR